MESRIDNTIVIIPSLNESKTIGGIVRNITGMGLRVLVIDDGSSDNTERLALDNGAMVIRNAQNRGKGFSVREGMDYVIDKMKYEWIIMMDADGQHDTKDLPVLMEATRGGGVDIVNGNRMESTKTMPPARYWTNRFTSWVLSLMCRQDIPDSQCGFRLMRVEALKNIALESDKYDIESEILIEAARSGLIIRSVPVRTIYGDEVSAINPVRDTVRFFSLVFRQSFKFPKKTCNGKKY